MLPKRWGFVAVVVGVLIVGSVPGGAQEARPGDEVTDFFGVDAGTTTTPIDVGDSLRVCATVPVDAGNRSMTYTMNNTPMTLNPLGNPQDSVTFEMDDEDCIQVVSCVPGTYPDAEKTIEDRSCDQANDGEIAPDRDSSDAADSYVVFDECFCMNTTGRVTLSYQPEDTTRVTGDTAWMNFTVRENQAVYDDWRSSEQVAGGGTQETTVSFSEGTVPFFSSLDTFAVPLFWLAGAVVLFISGWLVSGTYFVVGLLGHFTEAAWASDELLIGLAGLFLLAEMAANLTTVVREKLRGLFGRGVRG